MLCYCKPGLNKEENWKIVLPRKLIMSTIKWFHIVTGHPGEKILRSRLFHPELRHLVKKFKCGLCQRHKLLEKGYGVLPERDISTHPFQEVAVDLIGPWPVNIGNKDATFMTLSSIDPVTNLTKLARVDNKTAEHLAHQFAYTWLARYP